MTIILLVRHAVNDFVNTGKLAGWTAGVHLNETGVKQAELLGERLKDAPLKAIYSSPLERTIETATAIQQYHPKLNILEDEGIGEVRYGDWEGAKIADLRKRKLWEIVQEYPSRAVFPNGEAMRSVQDRIVNSLEIFSQRHLDDMIVVVCHADLIKMALAHYLGMHLDVFQRLVISPASISTLILAHGRPYIAGLNDTAHLLNLMQTQSGNET
ncbi:histidine phosphatase family protein [Anaerolineales bacterium]